MTTHNDAVALLLPGMSLNATIFPDLGLPTVTPNLSGVELGEDGISEELERDGFGVYVRFLDRELDRSDFWEHSHRVVVGHSFGGMLALSWLLGGGHRPAPKVDGVVLIATTAGPMYQRVKMRIPIPWGAGWRMNLGWAVPIWNRPEITKAVKWCLCAGKLDADTVDFRTRRILTDRELGLAGWRNTDWRAMRAFRYVMDGFNVRPRLGEITVPAIVLHGSEDSLFDCEDAHILGASLPAAQVRVVPGAGHALPITHGEEVVRAVRDLLAS